MVFQAYRSLRADSMAPFLSPSSHRRVLSRLPSFFVVPFGVARADYSAAYRDCMEARRLGFVSTVFVINPINNN